ncbi:uncharacterized protein LOC111717290 [Eurytemora carolleeae]|uniref:uncharacterized protein LOC111717290 n=1 Tax=Eurytemora carolleeae TaxID=1294199 RepID=UPI000C786D0A|nr:uncharacterized protein LOC111717290 [Eurytemora carolleeae]|eukprot:XP_023348559.1 uncharacterized protein LOC111717290 [Eurytemora affinis]
MSEEKDFNVFAGAETGIFKGLNINSKCSLSKNFDKISNLTKESSISCMSYGEDEQEILIGLRSQYVKVFDVKDKSYSTVVETKAGTGPVVGVARYNEAILTAVESGLVKLWKYENPVEFNPIDYEETYILKYLSVYKY